MKSLLFRFTILCSMMLYGIVTAEGPAAQFLYWQPSARSYSMGGAGVASAQGSMNAFYNPAGLAANHELALTSSYVEPFPFFENTRHSFSSLAIPIGDLGSVAITWNRFWRESQLQLDTEGRQLGVDREEYGFFDPAHWFGQVAYGLNLGEQIAVGVSMGYLSSTLSDVKVSAEQNKGDGNAVLIGFGMIASSLMTNLSHFDADESMVSPIVRRWAREQGAPGISVGFTLQNAGTQLSYIDDEQKDPAPTYAVLGISYRPISTSPFELQLAADVEKRFRSDASFDYVHLGSEAVFMRVLAFREGIFWDVSDPANTYFTYGLGLQSKYFSVNVARYNRSLQPTWHFDAAISVGL